MRKKKIKTYVLMVSKVFPKTHPRAGKQTHFAPKIIAACGGEVEYKIGGKNYVFDRQSNYVGHCVLNDWEPKIHTIRENYDLWAARAEKINRGEAILSLRQWTGSPYNFAQDGSKQEEFMQLTKIGVQIVKLHTQGAVFCDDGHKSFAWSEKKEIAKNDGLNFGDFYDWFFGAPKRITNKNRYVEKECVIIHFTDFRY